MARAAAAGSGGGGVAQDGGVDAAFETNGALAALEENLAVLDGVAAREEDAYGDLAAQLAPAPVGRIPLFGHDVHEVAALERAADCLFN